MTAVPGGVWCVLSDQPPEALPALGGRMLAAGASALTLRRPAGTARSVVDAWRARELASAWRAVHAHADWAAASGARAVIAGTRSLALGQLRRAFPGLLLGASVHDQAEAERACADGAGFLLFGPVWETPAKAGVLAPRGLAPLARVAALGLPVIAIGGITAPEQLRAARAHGAHACAVLRAALAPERLDRLIRA